MAGQMYFGTRDNMRWVKCPSSGMGRNSVGYVAEGLFLNGGAFARNSRGTHNQYDMSWNFLRANEKADIKPYFEGVYGDGPVYFLDPFAMRRNVLPALWASPEIATGSSTSLLRNEYPTRGTRSMSASMRTNYSRNPEAVGPVDGSGNVPMFGYYATGVGETGTTTVVPGGQDGPVMADGRILGYARRTVTSPKTSGSTGWRGDGTSMRNPLVGVTGDVVWHSVYARFSAVTDPGTIHRTVRLRSEVFGASASVTQANSNTIVLPLNEWVRIDLPVTATGAFVSAAWWLYQTSGSNLPAGSTLDVTGLLVEKNVPNLGTFFSGASLDNQQVDNGWVGSPNAAASTQTLRLPQAPPASARYILSGTSVSKECYLPVPGGHTLHLAGYYSATGTAAVVLVSDSGTITTLPVGLTSTTSVSVTGSTGYTLKMTGVGVIDLGGLMAQVLPTGQSPDFSRFYPGEGHSGCRQSGQMSDTGYSSPQALDYSALSVSLIETGSWES